MPTLPDIAPLSDLPTLFRASAYGPDSRETRRLSRQAARGELKVVHPGVYVSLAEWQGLDKENRHRLRIRAAVPSLGPRLVVSHRSALTLHGLPTLGEWPRRIHVTDPSRPSSQAWATVVKHAGPLSHDSVEMRDGILVTSAVRTLVDVCLTASFSRAIVSVDAGLHRATVSREAFNEDLALRASGRNRVSAARIIAFASDKSDSVGESWCRCRMLELNAPVPILQHVFEDSLGRVGPVDFWFAEFGVVVEFDGDVKYLDERFANGMTASEIVLKERRRERRLLALPEVRTVVRVAWRDLAEPWRLRRLLAEAGVPVK